MDDARADHKQRAYICAAVKARSQRPEAFDVRGNRGWFGFFPASRTFFRRPQKDLEVAHLGQHLVGEHPERAHDLLLG